MTNTPVSDPVMTGLIAARKIIESRSDSWAHWMVVATVFVAIGVLVELYATISEVREEICSGGHVKRHHIATFIGSTLVVAFVCLECVAEFQSGEAETQLRTNIAAAEAELTKRANSAIVDAVTAVNEYGGLHEYVGQAVKNMNDERKQFALAAANEHGEFERVAANLKHSTAEVQASQTELRSASETIKDLRQQVRYLSTPLILDDPQAAELAMRLSIYRNTPFDLFVADDHFAVDFMRQLGNTLEKAGWVRMPVTPSVSPVFYNNPGKPSAGVITTQGIEVTIAVHDELALKEAATALTAGLVAAGRKVSRSVKPDEAFNSDYNRGAIHILVGSK